MSQCLALAVVAFVGPASCAAASDPGYTPLKVIQPLESTFPATLLADGITSGHVRAVLHVDADGRLADCLVTAYTRRELAAEILASLREWQFEPARESGEPVGTRTEILFTDRPEQKPGTD